MSGNCGSSRELDSSPPSMMISMCFPCAWGFRPGGWGTNWVWFGYLSFLWFSFSCFKQKKQVPCVTSLHFDNILLQFKLIINSKSAVFYDQILIYLSPGKAVCNESMPKNHANPINSCRECPYVVHSSQMLVEWVHLIDFRCWKIVHCVCRGECMNKTS